MDPRRKHAEILYNSQETKNLEQIAYILNIHILTIESWLKDL
jgi:hypothetical protein